jgi:signal peptidase
MAALLALWDELRARPGPFHLEMRGGSMWPAAPEGSVLAVEPCPASVLRAGELVTFRRGCVVVTHRVIAIAPDGCVIAWGDSLLRPDPPIPPGDVLGRARVVQRGPMLFRAPFWTGWVAARRLGAGALRLASRARVRGLREP